VILPDVNVLVYAMRSDDPQHEACRRWLTNIVGGDGPYGLSSLTLCAVVRIATNARIHRPPSTPEDAFRFCDYLRLQPNCRLIEPGARHWDIFRRLTMETGIRGPDVTDAWYAALAIEHGCEWVTTDRGFSRFPGLRWSVPT
jgi:toxin-antitoxin system PIN domain toxin